MSEQKFDFVHLISSLFDSVDDGFRDFSQGEAFEALGQATQRLEPAADEAPRHLHGSRDRPSRADVSHEPFDLHSR